MYLLHLCSVFANGGSDCAQNGSCAHAFEPNFTLQDCLLFEPNFTLQQCLNA